MKSFRSVIFWIHLAVGVTAGIVIFIMSVTGVALTYEKQMIEWADRHAWTAPASTAAAHLPPETLLAKVAEAQPGTAAIGMTLRADAAAPATVDPRGQRRRCWSILTPARSSASRRPPSGPSFAP